MATILIEPIKLQSEGGYTVVLNGISPNDHDCIVGKITTPGQGTISGCWDLSGYLRGGNPDCNLDMRQDELLDLAELVKCLSPKG